MLGNPNQWQKLGRIISPSEDIYWMANWAGPATAIQINSSSRYKVFMAGRDVKNRSQIGSFEIDVDDLSGVESISEHPVLSFSEPGAFDENGVSYPWALKSKDKTFLYYNGWMPTVLTSFQIHLGLAISEYEKDFVRVSRAPILERSNEDYISIGSAGVLVDDDLWRMWYTSFQRWGRLPGEHKHYYVIKYAESRDGIHWRRDNIVSIDFDNEAEFSICRPSVIKHEGLYHMWFSYRGEQYRIGYASSADGINWNRQDSLAGIDVSESGWDSEAICYSFVFKHKDDLYMLYCGNEYGRTGLGLAKLSLP